MSNASPLVSIGDNCLDVYVAQDRLTIGGSALNVAAQWRQAGRRAEYFGVVGTDPAADIILQGARLAGLDATNIGTLPGPTGVTLIELVEQEREFLFEELGVGAIWRPRALPDAVLAASWCHVTGTAPEAGIPQRLVAAGKRVSVDLLGRPNGAIGSLRGIELAFTSSDGDESDAVELASELVDAGARAAVIMRGAEGSLALCDGEITVTAAESIDPVDTLGAGDSFIAACIAAWLDGGDISEALSAGTRAATLTCLHLGGFPQEPMPIPRWILHRYLPG